MEGNIKEWYRAENAIRLIDDPKVYGDGVTVRHIIHAVNILEGDLEGCKGRLRQDCEICGDSVPVDKVILIYLF